MNPGVAEAWTTCLPQSCASRVTAAATAGSVARPLTTSTSRITGAGLKKCRPTRRPGWLSPAAMAVGDSEEVLVASTQCGVTTFSRSANRACLTARSSATASITHAAGASSPRSPATISWRPDGSRSRRPLATSRATRSRTAATARPAAPSATSYTMTGWPATAATCAIPAPMVPAPTTATGADRLISVTAAPPVPAEAPARLA